MPDEATVSVVQTLLDYGAMGLLVIAMGAFIWFGMRKVMAANDKTVGELGKLSKSIDVLASNVNRQTDHIDSIESTLLENRRMNEGGLNSMRKALEEAEHRLEKNNEKTEKILTEAAIIRANQQNQKSS